MGKTVLVIAEHKNRTLRQVSLEALQAGLRLAGSDGKVISLVLGDEAAAEALAKHPHTEVLLAPSAALLRYNPTTHFPVVRSVVDRLHPDFVLMGHTAIGRDLAPLIASHLRSGQISDVVDIRLGDADGVEADGREPSSGAAATGTGADGGETTGAASRIQYKRPIYAGKAFETRRVLEGPAVITIRPNNMPPAEAKPEAATPITQVTDAATESASPDLASVIRDVVQKVSGKVDLTEAKIVVSGGRGVKSADGFKPLEELAEVLGAAVGASRGACDAGYCDYALQIGQTGKVVTPEVYIACGISGAIQHLAGMSQSRMIVAINKDPEAPIFKVADYGIVGDLFEVVPLLTAELKNALA